ncbi:MAG: FAA hydrolase family protein [Gammaproteobacteria bacterium]|jgi:2-keto-4-pentenoate hydratase/2-oxohepta-3-ene-1,7-dioic acid hydratase in catechol pathway|nr:MAG: FAA hydrolase family protein [Gammaproteobacteria bacterium]
MKLLRYGPAGHEKPGLMDNDGNIRSLADHVSDIDGSTISDETVATLNQLDTNDLPIVDNDVRLGPCVGNVGKFLCIGLNYSDHAAESGMSVPPEPEMFTKATSAVCGPDDDIVKPLNSDKLDWEVELAIIIGKHTSYVSEEEAADHIAGYCVCNDVSERTFQLEKGSQWDKGKGCDTFGPIGPWLVTRDEVENPLDLNMWLEVNGHRYQDGNTRTMVFGPAFIVSYLSQFMSLQPGDVISSGTPPGVGLGQKPPVYLSVGDKIELGIDGLGTQNQTVVALEK